MRQKLSEGAKPGYDARVGSGLGRGPNLRKKAVAAPWSGTWPAPGATLDLDFANDRGFVRGVGQGNSMQAVTFTRASNASWVGSDGLLNGNSRNLLRFTEDFDNSYWTKTENTITPNTVNTTDPLGGTTAELFTPLVNNAVHRVYIAGTVATTTSCVYTLSVKSNGYTKIGIRESATSGAGAAFDLSGSGSVIGAFNAGGSTVSNMSISSQGNGWFRIALTISFASATAQSFGIHALSPSYSAGSTIFESWTPNGTDGFYIWGAQLELGSTATEYFPTNINQPRFDWASTAQIQKNVLSFTNTFDGWGINALTATANATSAPDGTNTAKLFTETATNTEHRIFRSSQTFYFNLATVGVLTISVYAKANGRNFLNILVQDDGMTPRTTINITDGTYNAIGFGSGGSLISVGSTDVGSGWYRVSLSWIPSTNSPSLNYYFQLQNSSTNSASYLGDGTSGMYLWGAQLEIGSSATDYRPIAQPTSNTPLTANPTSNGLLIEESRTNRILWNRDATQANWVKTDVTAAKDQTGIDGVASAASSLTATSADGTCIQTITLASGSRTGSVYLKRITGTGTVQVCLDGSTYSTVDLSDTEWRRIVLSGTVTNPTVGIKIATSGDAVAMDYAQVEDGAFATTPILTTTATVTRSVDVATMAGANFDSWWDGKEQTIYSEILNYSVISGGDRDGITFSFGSFTNLTARHDYQVNATTYALDITTVGFSRSSLSSFSIPVGVLRKVASSIRQGRQFSSWNGVLSTISGPLSQVRADRLSLSGFGNFATRSHTAIKRLVFIPKYINETVAVEMTK